MSCIPNPQIVLAVAFNSYSDSDGPSSGVSRNENEKSLWYGARRSLEFFPNSPSIAPSTRPSSPAVRGEVSGIVGGNKSGNCCL